MSNRPKSKIQYGTPAPGSPGNPIKGDSGPIGTRIAIGAAIAVVLVTIIIFAAKDNGGKAVNNVAFQSATITGTPLPAMPSGGDAVPADDPAKGLTIPTVNGKSFDGSPVVIKPGKPQLIAIIAHWCPHCQHEVPLIVGWQESGAVPKSVTLTAVATAADESRGNFPPASWLAKENWKNPTMADTPRSDVLNAFGATGFPTLIAVTADGKVAQRASGELTLDQVHGLFEDALGNQTTSTAPASTPVTSPVPTSAP